MHTEKRSLAEHRDDDVKAGIIPLWAQSDIDRWQAHLMNASYEEAKGSHEYFRLIAWHGNKVVLTGRETDTVIILEARDGIVFIDCHGEGATTHYIGIMEGFHEVYIAHKE